MVGAVAQRHGYVWRFVPVGPDDPEVGPPTQMAVFTRTGQETDPDSAPGGTPDPAHRTITDDDQKEAAA